jgi:hypothetical protein
MTCTSTTAESLRLQKACNLGRESGNQQMMKTMKVHVWIGTLALAGAVCYASALFVTTPPAAGGASKAQQSSTAPQSSPAAPSVAEQSQIYDGVITDTQCGARHSAPLAETAAECTRVCVHSGDRFALVDGDKMYVLEGEPLALKRAAGERVRIAGTLNGNTISVTSVGAPKS